MSVVCISTCVRSCNGEWRCRGVSLPLSHTPWDLPCSTEVKRVLSLQPPHSRIVSWLAYFSLIFLMFCSTGIKVSKDQGLRKRFYCVLMPRKWKVRMLNSRGLSTGREVMQSSAGAVLRGLTGLFCLWAYFLVLEGCWDFYPLPCISRGLYEPGVEIAGDRMQETGSCSSCTTAYPCLQVTR